MQKGIDGEKANLIWSILQKLEGDVASWERLEGWESVGKVEQFTMRSVLRCPVFFKLMSLKYQPPF